MFEKTDDDWEKTIYDAKKKEDLLSQKNITKNLPTEKALNISKFCKVFTGDLEEVLQTIESETQDDEGLEEAIKDNNSYTNNLLYSLYHGLHTAQCGWLKETLKLIKADNVKLIKSIEGLTDTITRGTSFNNSPELSGARAKETLIARTGGVMKVYLFNSGFWINVRSLNLSELNSFYDTVDINGKEFGKILGGHSYLLYDNFIKQQFCDFIPKMVLSSNLKDWHKKSNLLNKISFHDYPTILWAACCMLFKRGLEIGVVCSNQECKHIENNTKLDIKKMRVTNFDALSETAITMLRSDDEKSTKDIEAYKKELNLTEEFKHSNFKITASVPSIGEYLKISNELTSSLINALRGEPNLDNKEIISMIAIYFYPTLAPWISKLTFLKPDDSIDFFTKDTSVILNFLVGYKRTEEKDVEDLFVDKFQDFIKRSRLSLICSQPLECPKCHKGIETEDDLFPLDLHELFFMITCRQLEIGGSL